MTKNRKGFIGLLLSVMLLLGVCALAACGSKDLTVTFSVEGKTQQVEVVDGKVAEMPADPTKEFYSFRGWYTTSAFEEGTEFTKDTEVKTSITVYAYFAPIKLNISVNGESTEEIKLEELASKTAEYTAEANSRNLTFDGWYIDSAYGTKYTSQDADNLYARYAATVTFDNGYEDLKVVLAAVGSTMKAPDKEYSDFVPYYMDSEDISYVDENGNAVDFENKTVTTNERITVLWKSPYLSYVKIEGTTNDYAVAGFDYGGDTSSDAFKNIQRFPAVSFLSENVTIDGKEGCNVVAVDFTQSAINTVSTAYCTSCVYVVFHEGIQYISSFAEAAKIEKVELPSTLQIIEKSFWNMGKLKSLELPEGLEIIIDSFWGDYLDGMVGYYRGESAFDFDVVIPASVKTIVTAPSNLKFAEGSEFYYEDGELYKNRTIGGVTYKTLVCTYQSKVSDDTLTVKEGVEAIAVGAFHDVTAKFISVPSTFKAISYASDENDETYEYTFYTGKKLTDMSRVQSPDSSAAPESYSVYTGLGNNDVSYIFINTKEMPEGVSEYAFTDNSTPYTELEDNDGLAIEKVVFVGTIENGDDVIIHIVGNDTRDSSKKQTYPLSGKKSGDTLGVEEILKAVGIDSEQYTYSVSEFGVPYSGGKLSHNLYLNVDYKENVFGVKYTVDEKTQTITVTGFDVDSAKDLGGVYRIAIDFSFDSELAEYKVVIAKDAFKNNNNISEVYVGNKVVTIGESAFEGTSNLSKFIVTDGGLEEVKKNAFLNAGCEVSGDTITVNEAIKEGGITMVLPLAKMKNIEPYAFKTKAIYTFTQSEADLNSSRTLNQKSESGNFYFIENLNSEIYGIVKYVSYEIVTMQDDSGKDTQITVYDVQYVATAGGFQNSSGHMGIGMSKRYYGYMFGAYVEMYKSWQSYVYRYEVMEGSIYYLGSAFNNITFGLFTKIHKNAFTDMEETRYRVYDGISYDVWMDADKIRNQDSSLFEEGWFEGRDNSENTFMSELESDDENSL